MALHSICRAFALHCSASVSYTHLCEALGYKVKRLVRVRIMNITLGNLKSGEVRKLSKQELKELYEQAGANAGISGTVK